MDKPRSRIPLALRLGVVAVVCTAVVFATDRAHAQTAGEFAESGSLVEAPTIFRQKDLVLPQGENQVNAGAVIVVDGGGLLGVPLGGAFGPAQNLEVGLGFLAVFKPSSGPFTAGGLLTNTEVFGRYRLIPNQLAVQATVRVPGTLTDINLLNVDIEVPLRIEISDKMRLFVQAALQTNLKTFRSVGITTAVNLMYFIRPELFANVQTQLSLGIRPALLVPIDDTALPLAVGGGYMLGPNSGVGGNFTIGNLNGFDGIGFTFLFITTV